jgi:hypothetical protein
MTILHQCAFCKHFQGHKGTKSLCAAFPEGIPDTIYNNEFDHRQPYPDDNGIRFEQSEYSLQLGGLHPFEMETKLLSNWRKVHDFAPKLTTEEDGELEERLQRRGHQFKRGVLTPREYGASIISALYEYDRMLGWRYAPEFSEIEWFRYPICSGCQAELHWDRHYPYSYVSSDYPDIIFCSLDMQNCLRCGTPVCEERFVTYQPNCNICGQEVGPGKRRRSATIDYDNYDTPRRWKCEECYELEIKPERVSAPEPDVEYSDCPENDNPAVQVSPYIPG